MASKYRNLPPMNWIGHKSYAKYGAGLGFSDFTLPRRWSVFGEIPFNWKGFRGWWNDIHHSHQVNESYFWSNYSDLTRPGPPKGSEGREIPLFHGFSRLVHYYNLARYFEGECLFMFVCLVFSLYRFFLNDAFYSQRSADVFRRWLFTREVQGSATRITKKLRQKRSVGWVEWCVIKRGVRDMI